MPRSNSEGSSGGSITSSDEERIGPSSPISTHAPGLPPPMVTGSPPPASGVPEVEAPIRPQLSGIKTLGVGGSAPSSRFKASAIKVMQMNKSSARFLKIDGAGAEPGADPRRPSTSERYTHIHEECNVHIVDYGMEQTKFYRFDRNKNFVDFINSPTRSERPAWANVRWVNIGGVSWDVLSSLALKYDLHPLSLEDVLHGRRTSLSKADYYTKHLFISMLCHSLSAAERAKEDNNVYPSPLMQPSSHTKSTLAPSVLTIERTASPVGTLPRPVTSKPGRLSSPTSEHSRPWLANRFSSRRRDGTILPDDLNDEDEDKGYEQDDGLPWDHIGIPGKSTNDDEDNADDEGAGSTPGQKRKRLPSLSPEKRAMQAKLALIERLKEKDRVGVDVTNLYLFLLRDGTLISVYQNGPRSKTKKRHVPFALPLLHRIARSNTILRSSADASLLLQAILDYVVDDTMEVAEKYHGQILELEGQVLIRPKMTIVQHLHILSGELTKHKRTMAPVKSLVYGLRRYDLDRCQAMVASLQPGADAKKVEGFMSHTSKVYLADVVDHMEYVLSNMDMYLSVTENMTNFTFNTISYQTNETMRRLTLITIVFLPLTFLTGYFGMNFDLMWSVHGRSDILFWEIAIPSLIVVLVGFLWQDIQRSVHSVQKRMLRKKLIEKHKQD